MIIYGGELRIARELHNKSCLNDIYAFDMEEIRWGEIQPAGPFIIGRKGHACCLLGKYMIVHGGVDNNNNVLNEIYALN